MTADTAVSLQERLAAVRAAAERDAHRTPAAARAILEARARALARRIGSADDAGDDTIDLLLVQVGDERLAVPLDSIVAIARSGSITPLPRAVAPVYGVTAWRGRPLTVLSLSPSRPAMTADTRLVVLGTGSRAALAVVVDVVDDVRRTPRAEISAAGPGPRHRYALGITSDGLLVVSGDALLHPATLSTSPAS